VKWSEVHGLLIVEAIADESSLRVNFEPRGFLPQSLSIILDLGENLGRFRNISRDFWSLEQFISICNKI
jgi:hypothetical protein